MPKKEIKKERIRNKRDKKNLKERLKEKKQPNK